MDHGKNEGLLDGRGWSAKRRREIEACRCLVGSIDGAPTFCIA